MSDQQRVSSSDINNNRVMSHTISQQHVQQQHQIIGITEHLHTKNVAVPCKYKFTISMQEILW